MNSTAKKKSMKHKIYKNFLNPITEFREFDKDVKSYIGMHCIGGLFFSYIVILPVFMHKMGIDILEAGLIFGFAAVADVILTFILGKFLDKISPNSGMVLDWFTESWPVFIFAFATTYIHFFIGILAQKATNLLTPSYKVYENEIFPEEDRSLIYTYHLFVPEISKIIIFPIIGYLLTYKFNTTLALRVTFFICGIGFLATSLIPKKILKRVEPFQLEREKTVFHFSKDLYWVACAEVLILICSQLTSLLITCYYILDKLNGTLLDIVLVESISSLVIIIVGLISRDFIKKFSEFKIAQFGILFFALYTGLMSIANSFTLVFLAIILQAIGHTLWFPSHSSILMSLVPKKKRGLFFGSLSSFSKLLTIAIPILSGVIAKQFGFFFIFILAFSIYIATFFIYQILLKKSINVGKNSNA